MSAWFLDNELPTCSNKKLNFSSLCASYTDPDFNVRTTYTISMWGALDPGCLVRGIEQKERVPCTQVVCPQ